MISYLYTRGEPACSRNPLKVQLDGRIIGEIRKVASGQFQYFPKGQKEGGEVFSTVTLVQKSLSE